MLKSFKINHCCNCCQPSFDLFVLMAGRPPNFPGSSGRPKLPAAPHVLMPPPPRPPSIPVPKAGYGSAAGMPRGPAVKLGGAPTPPLPSASSHALVPFTPKASPLLPQGFLSCIISIFSYEGFRNNVHVWFYYQLLALGYSCHWLTKDFLAWWIWPRRHPRAKGQCKGFQHRAPTAKFQWWWGGEEGDGEVQFILHINFFGPCYLASRLLCNTMIWPFTDLIWFST